MKGISSDFISKLNDDETNNDNVREIPQIINRQLHINKNHSIYINDLTPLTENELNPSKFSSYLQFYALEGFKSLLIIPLKTDQSDFGDMVLCSKESNTFSERKISQMESFVKLIARSIDLLNKVQNNGVDASQELYSEASQPHQLLS